MSKQGKESSNSSALHAEVEARFGVLPNFFKLAPDSPEVTANLWGFAQFGYLDNPLPSVFKERLFVYLSRFCEVRYCISRHVGFLIGLGRPAGDAASTPESLEQVVRLLRRPLPREEALEPHLIELESLEAPLVELPAADSRLDESVFACATHVFLQTPQEARSLGALRQAFPPEYFEHFLAFLAFVRTAHFWTKLHPELEVEADIAELLAVHEGLAECVLNDPEAETCATTQMLLNELASLRKEKLQAVRLQESEERYRALAMASAQIVWTTNAAGEVIEDSPSWREFTGQTYDEWKGQGWLEALHPSDRASATRAWSEATEHKKLYEQQYRLRRFDGEYRWTAARGVPVLEADGRVREWVGTNTDITAGKEAQAEIEASDERYRLALESAELGSWHVDTATMELTTNERFREIFGVVGDCMTYAEAFEIIHPEDRVLVEAAVEAATRPVNPVPYALEYRVIHPDGTVRWVFAKGRVNFEEVGGKRKLASFDGTLADVTKQRRAQERLREIAARLSEADRRKDEFLATLAHELRNPLAPIRSGLEVMRLAKDDVEVVETVRETIERQTLQMVRLVDDLLDVSRITRNKLELRTCQVELEKIVRSAVEASQPGIEEAGHTFEMNLPAEPIILNADPNRLAQVISNLLDNASKYTPDGGKILLTVERENDFARISVRDNGIGIPKENWSEVFELFAQIDRPLERGYKGLGIGLTLVKRLVEMHGGTIHAESAGAGQGSEFIVLVPRLQNGAMESPMTSKESEVKSARLRVLVVDDNTAAAKMLGMMIRMLGNEVQSAQDGEEAVEVAEEFAPDVVLMDIGMPRMNGYEAAQKIREQSWGKEMVLVALTGWGQEEDKRRAMEAGFNSHLVKSADPDELKQLFRRLQEDIVREAEVG